MPIELPTRKSHARSRGWSGPDFAAAAVVVAGASCTLVWSLPMPLVLPAIGVLATLAAALVALIAWRTTQQAAVALTYWDIAGALTFIGVFATLLSEPELALPLLESQRTE